MSEQESNKNKAAHVQGMMNAAMNAGIKVVIYSGFNPDKDLLAGISYN